MGESVGMLPVPLLLVRGGPGWRWGKFLAEGRGSNGMFRRGPGGTDGGGGDDGRYLASHRPNRLGSSLDSPWAAALDGPACAPALARDP